MRRYRFFAELFNRLANLDELDSSEHGGSHDCSGKGGNEVASHHRRSEDDGKERSSPAARQRRGDPTGDDAGMDGSDPRPRWYAWHLVAMTRRPPK